MKKVILLAAFTLLGSTLVSCDGNRAGTEEYAMGYNTDDGFTLQKPKLPPPPPPPHSDIKTDKS